MKSGMNTMLLVGAVAILAGVNAMAADTCAIRAKVPFDFMVGNDRVAAGEYTVTQDPARNSVRITERDTGATLIALRHPAGKNASGLPYSLVFYKYGDRHFLREIWAGSSTAGVRLPVSRTEKETMVARAAEKTTLTASAVR